MPARKKTTRKKAPVRRKKPVAPAITLPGGEVHIHIHATPRGPSTDVIAAALLPYKTLADRARILVGEINIAFDGLFLPHFGGVEAALRTLEEALKEVD